MADQVVEVTRVSWFARLREAIGGVILGGILFLASFPILIYNEGRAVKTAKALGEGAAAVVSISADRVDPAMEGKLVHMTGIASTNKDIKDPVLGVSARAIRLQRIVEMYQWKEEQETQAEKKLGGGEERRTVYTYSQGWSDHAIKSSGFKEPSGHANPGSLPLPSDEWSASEVTVGAFLLPLDMISSLGNFEPVSLESTLAPKVSAALNREVKAIAGQLYIGIDPASPRVGDVRILLKAVKPGAVSVVARQVGRSFEAYRASNGRSLRMLREGTLSAQAMFEKAQSVNAILTWALRGAGFLMIFLGLSLIFKPLSVVFDVIPLLGTLVGMGAGAAAFCVSAILSLLTIATAWMAYRPMLALTLIGCAVVLAAIFRQLALKSKARAASSQV